MTTRHLDLGCGSTPRNPYRRDEAHGIDIALPERLDPRFFRRANLAIEPIPHADSRFDSVSAFDFLEHVPRILGTADGRGTRFPFVELMSEIYRVLKPGGRFYAVTPAFPRPEAFHDPTHVNCITDGTWSYFCGEAPAARMYGYTGRFDLLLNAWALHPEALTPDAPLTPLRRFKRWRRSLTGGLTHVAWEFACVKPVR
ncbi:MAG: methyltransferase domain-containing protein [Pseudomonadota bacterium]|nr:methyltransferase domain-containing protein [Pseudomonadota bacterium]